MSKEIIKIAGVWKPVIPFVKVAGVWKKPDSFIKVAGVWKKSTVTKATYTFKSSITASATTGILLSSYIDPNSADEFDIIINSGVTLRGRTGNAGGNGAGGADGTRRSNCRQSNTYGAGGNGGRGGSGYGCFNLTGFSGKKVNLIVNGTIIGGTGGRGGRGGNYYPSYAVMYSDSIYGGCGGAGGAGGGWLYSNGGAILSYPAGTSRLKTGGVGSGGSNGSSGTGSRVPGCCFLAGSKVLMADGTYKNIEDVKIGDKLRGAYESEVIVASYARPLLGNRKLWKVNNLINTTDHPVVNGARDGFVALDIDAVEAERGDSIAHLEDGSSFKFWFDAITREKTKIDVIELGSIVATKNGTETITTIEELSGYDNTTQLYSFDVTGSHTYCVNGYFVGGGATDVDFDYSTGEQIAGKESHATKILREGKIL